MSGEARRTQQHDWTQQSLGGRETRSVARAGKNSEEEFLFTVKGSGRNGQTNTLGGKGEAATHIWRQSSEGKGGGVERDVGVGGEGQTVDLLALATLLLHQVTVAVEEGRVGRLGEDGEALVGAGPAVVAVAGAVLELWAPAGAVDHPGLQEAAVASPR